LRVTALRFGAWVEQLFPLESLAAKLGSVSTCTALSCILASARYNTLTGNCTTLVFGMLRTIHPGLPLDYRVLLSGYLPNYAYDLGATDTSMPFERLP
jgi:Domain of unknown function (DUF4105)